MLGSSSRVTSNSNSISTEQLMKNKGMRTVRVADLRENLFVRKVLDQDHALYLAELMDGGVEMRDPIEVTDLLVPNSIVDGRHRKHAFDVNGVEEVKVRVLEFEDEAEMIAYAYKANTGGSKPPTQEDTEHTIDVLLNHGVAKKRIGEILNLPLEVARKYINSVQSKLERQKVMRAAAAIRDGGLTLAKAAVQYDVDPDKVKAALGGKKKAKHGVEELQRTLTTAYRSLGMKNARAIRSLLEKHEDGDVAEKQVRSIFDHIEHLQRQSTKSVADWKKRFETKNEKTTTSDGAATAASA